MHYDRLYSRTLKLDANKQAEKVDIGIIPVHGHTKVPKNSTKTVYIWPQIVDTGTMPFFALYIHT